MDTPVLIHALFLPSLLLCSFMCQAPSSTSSVFSSSSPFHFLTPSPFPPARHFVRVTPHPRQPAASHTTYPEFPCLCPARHGEFSCRTTRSRTWAPGSSPPSPLSFGFSQTASLSCVLGHSKVWSTLRSWTWARIPICHLFSRTPSAASPLSSPCTCTSATSTGYLPSSSGASTRCATSTFSTTA